MIPKLVDSAWGLWYACFYGLGVLQEGKAYLDKNLTEWKKPYLMENEDGDPVTDGEDGDEELETDTSPVKKAKLSKHTTMKGTAKVDHIANLQPTLSDFVAPHSTPRHWTMIYCQGSIT